MAVAEKAEKPAHKRTEAEANFIKAVDAFIDAVGPTNSRLAPNLDGWMNDLRQARAILGE